MKDFVSYCEYWQKGTKRGVKFSKMHVIFKGCSWNATLTAVEKTNWR